MSNEENVKSLFCNFCGKKQNEVKKLISGPDVYICNECVELCYSVLTDNNKHQKTSENSDELPTPKQIHNFLNDYVIGQEYAKRVLSVGIYNHFIRLQNLKNEDVELDKSCILLTGPTGSGKTFLLKNVARLLDVPFVSTDATTLTESGYVGDDVESIVSKLLQTADYNVEKTQKGIIYIDEIDKKCVKGESTSITRDVSGEGVQQALLKIIEGTKCRVTTSGGRKNPNQDTVEVDTTNILFILGGSFVGLEKIIQEGFEESSIGFNASIKNPSDNSNTGKYLNKLEPHHLMKFGIIPELAGRLPVYAHLEELNKDELIKVMTEPKNSLLKQFKKMFEIQNIELEFTEKALDRIAQLAIERKTGARGLRSVIEKILLPVQYDLPEMKSKNITKVEINEKVVDNEENPVYIYNQQQKSV